jgi:hypothetical protein
MLEAWWVEIRPWNSRHLFGNGVGETMSRALNTPKSRVLAQYPKAYADQHIRGRNWHIFDEMFRRTPALSAGRIFRSARAAWAYAAERLK